MTDLFKYFSALGSAWINLTAFILVVVFDFCLKYAAPKLYEKRFKGEAGRLILVGTVAALLLSSGFIAWRTESQENADLRRQLAKATQTTSPSTSSGSGQDINRSAPSADIGPRHAPSILTPSKTDRLSNQELTAQIDALLSEAQSIEANFSQFNGDYDQAASSRQIVRWQTSAARFLREQFGADAEREFRSASPIPPNARVGNIINGPSTSLVSLFTAQREVLYAYRP